LLFDCYRNPSLNAPTSASACARSRATRGGTDAGGVGAGWLALPRSARVQHRRGCGGDDRDERLVSLAALGSGADAHVATPVVWLRRR
jgi:hypothetical protein